MALRNLKTIVVEQPLLKSGCTLGEGPLYDSRTSILHFVDIEQNKIIHYDTVSHTVTTDEYDEPVTCLALRTNGQGLACAAARGFALIEPGSSVLKYLVQPISEDDLELTRFNDGACDSRGRFFAGTMSKAGGNLGKLYRYDPEDGSCIVIDEGPFTDSNGMGWSSDGKTFYFTDSLVNHIHAYDCEDGEISNRRLFVDAIAQGMQEETYPDGLCLDDEGCIWSARWGASRIVRYKPDGTMDVEVYFPTVLNVTACCFGGPNEDQLYVTTAHCGANGGDASRQAQYPDSGHLFVVDLSGQFKGGQWRYEFAG